MIGTPKKDPSPERARSGVGPSKKGAKVYTGALFAHAIFHLKTIFSSDLWCLRNDPVHELPAQKSLIKKFQPNQKLWLFEIMVQVAPSTSCQQVK